MHAGNCRSIQRTHSLPVILVSEGAMQQAVPGIGHNGKAVAPPGGMDLVGYDFPIPAEHFNRRPA
jgi:hypothetical protein